VEPRLFADTNLTPTRQGVRAENQGGVPITRFADYEVEGARWITVVESDFYPDYLVEAAQFYAPFMATFRQAAEQSSSSADLLRTLSARRGSESTQLMRIFRKYGSPTTSVEMLKRKTKVEEVIRDFGPTFRPIEQVRATLSSRACLTIQEGSHSISEAMTTIAR
jgi:hypothetical protein